MGWGQAWPPAALPVQAALSAMVQLEVPHLNVLTKVDLLKRSNVDLEE